MTGTDVAVAVSSEKMPNSTPHVMNVRFPPQAVAGEAERQRAQREAEQAG